MHYKVYRLDHEKREESERSAILENEREEIAVLKQQLDAMKNRLDQEKHEQNESDARSRLLSTITNFFFYRYLFEINFTFFFFLAFW
jgi:hypothetical protein